MKGHVTLQTIHAEVLEVKQHLAAHDKNMRSDHRRIENSLSRLRCAYASGVLCNIGNMAVGFGIALPGPCLSSSPATKPWSLVCAESWKSSNPTCPP